MASRKHYLKKIWHHGKKKYHQKIDIKKVSSVVNGKKNGINGQCGITVNKKISARFEKSGIKKVSSIHFIIKSNDLIKKISSNNYTRKMASKHCFEKVASH